MYLFIKSLETLKDLTSLELAGRFHVKTFTTGSTGTKFGMMVQFVILKKSRNMAIAIFNFERLFLEIFKMAAVLPLKCEYLQKYLQ